MRRALKNYKVEIILFLSALIVQLVVFFLTWLYGEGGFLWSSDAEGYFEIGKNLAAGKGFILHPAFGPQALRVPGYPLFIAFWYLIFSRISFVVLTQNLLSAANVVLVYIFGKRFFGNSTGLLASLFFMFESQRLQNSNQLMSETLFISFFIVGIYHFLSYLAGVHTKKIILSGIFLGLATLTKPVTQFLPIVLLAFLLIYGTVRQRHKSVFWGGFVFMAAFVAVLSPWLIRNKIHFGTFSLSATGGANLYYVNAAHFLESKAKVIGKEVNVYKDLTEQAIQELGFVPPVEGDPTRLFLNYGVFDFKYDTYFRNKSLEIVSSDWPFYLKLHLKRLLVFMIESSASRSWSAVLAGLSPPSVIFYPVLFWGGRVFWSALLAVLLFGFLTRRTWKEVVFSKYVLFALIIFYFANLTGLNYDAPRMRLPVNPLFFLLVADQIVRFKKRGNHEVRHEHKSMAEVYQQVPANYWDESWKRSPLQRLWHTGTLRAVQEEVKKIPRGLKLLDIGCGSGFALEKITRTRSDLDVYGVDIAPHLIEYAREHRPHIKFQVAEGEGLPFPDAEFQAVTSLDVLEHLVDLDAGLREARRVLAPDGTLIVLVALETNPLFRLVWWLWSHLKGRIWHEAHLRVFTQASLREAVERAGFRVEKIKSVNLGMSTVLRAQK